METFPEISFIKHFQELEDPRILKKTAHNLMEIILIAICAVICGADTWIDIEEFGNSRISWLKKFLKLENGIPSHDTFARVFSLLDPYSFQKCFQSWTSELYQLTKGASIAIDGKTLRRSHNQRNGKKALHIVHAWATESGILLGQKKTDEKSNEITAIPELLDTIMVKGCVVTIDAMGCQKKIAEKIYDQGGDYVLTVKDNQSDLKQAIEKTFIAVKEKRFEDVVHGYYENTEADHGRIETRKYYVLPMMYFLGHKLKWKGLRSLILVESERMNKSTGVVTKENRYYISSIKLDAQKIATAIRNHWKIENNLHWCLDVVFREDAFRVRIKNAAKNMSLLRKLVLLLLKKEKQSKRGLNGKRLKASWDTNYLQQILSCS